MADDALIPAWLCGVCSEGFDDRAAAWEHQDTRHPTAWVYWKRTIMPGDPDYPKSDAQP